MNLLDSILGTLIAGLGLVLAMILSVIIKIKAIAGI